MKELRHDRHTVSLLADHLVITPKYRGKILTGKVGFITEAVIRSTCAQIGIKIIDIAVNPDHVHIFFHFPPKYSLSFIAKKDKRQIEQDTEAGIPTPSGMVWRASPGAGVLSRLCGAGLGCCSEVHIFSELRFGW